MSQAFTPVTIVVSKSAGNGKPREKIGEQKIFVPVLKDILPFITTEIKKDEKGADVMGEEGLPVYADVRANWLQDSILAAVKAQARNKLIPGTATVKDGQKIAETWEELTAETLRDGSGLALAREFKNAFGEWVAKQGLSEAAANTLITLVGNKAALTLQQQGTKDKVKARLEAFAMSMDEAQVEKFMRPLEAAVNACSETEDAMDF